jgi:colicin import membrane protein
MASAPAKSYLVTSVCAHVVLLIVLMVNAMFASTKPVFENTNQNDVISAVVLGDSAKSKIIPQKITPPPATPKKIEKAEEPPKPKQVKTVAVAPPKKDVIALEKPKPQKIKKKVEEKPKINDKALAGLLNDIEKEVKKQKKTDLAKTKKAKPTKQLAAKYAKMLQTQAEETMRQAMLEEDLRLQGEQARQSQGEVDKYKALIIQAISEHWVIPVQSNRKLSSELMIRLSPGGTVLDVQITRSSGDPALDSSARAAVLKASPLPVPKDAKAFEAFRRFVLNVKPENIVNG